MIKDLPIFGLKLERQVSPNSYIHYMYVLRRWSTFLDGEEPNLETADAFLASLVVQGRANSMLSTLPALRKYLEWKDPEVETRVLYDKYGKEYRRTHRYNDYLLKWRDHRMQIQNDGKRTWVQIPYRRSKPEKCEVCGKVTKKLSYHHWDDDNLSKGLWSCSRCHWVAGAVEATNEYSDIVEKYLEMKSIAEQDFQNDRTG